MKLLVTGGAGFIGARIISQLLEAGHTVTAFDNLSTGFRDAVPDGARLVEGDLRDAAAIRAAMPGHDAVIHLAAQALVPESVADPQKAFDINLVGGQNLLEAMRAADVKRLVYSSTCAVYGVPDQIPISETTPKAPVNPYGASKYAFEQILHAYHAAYGFSVTIFRYFNPYGPTERHDPETHAIPSFINATLDDLPIPLYWKGEQIRDFFFVDDIARAHVMGLQRDGFEDYNLGSGSGVVVKDALNKIFQIAGKTTSINDLGERPGDPPKLFADTTKANEVLGWEPEVSLDEGLKRTIDAFRARRG